MEERLEAILIWLEESVKATGEFVAEQTPEVIREIILFHRVSYSCLVGFFLIILLILWTRAARNKCWGRELRNSDTEDLAAANLFGTGILTFVSVVVIAANLSNFLMVWLTPRLFLIEWVGRAF